MIDTSFREFVLQFDDCEEPDVKHVEIALDLEEGLAARKIMHCFRELPWSRSKGSSHPSRTDLCVSAIKGSFWNKCLNIEGLRECSLSPSPNAPIQGIGETLTKHQSIADLMLNNLDFFGKELKKNFDGIFFTAHENFTWHPALSLKQAFCVSQAAFARKLGTTRGFIHVHKMSGVPRTIKSARTTALWLREKCPSIPGIRYQRTLHDGAPYILSAVYPQASIYMDAPQTIELTPRPSDPFPIKCTKSV